METLLQSLAAKYGFDVAAKMLGIDKQKGNPKYTFGMPFTGGKLQINPMNMLKRMGLNQGIKSIMAGGKMSLGLPLIAATLGLGYLTNPLREGSYNYNPNLQGQIDYLSNRDMIGKNTSSGLLQYGPDSVLRGQNVVSGFGTNDYRDQLQKKKSYFEDRISKGKNYSQTQYEKTLNEIKEYKQDQVNKELAEEKKAADIKSKNTMTSNQSYTPPNIHSGGSGDGAGNQNAGGAQLGSGMSTGQHAAFRMARGGIASL